MRISFINLIFITKEQSFITHLNNRETNYQLLDINIRVMSCVIGYDVLVMKTLEMLILYDKIFTLSYPNKYSVQNYSIVNKMHFEGAYMHASCSHKIKIF